VNTSNEWCFRELFGCPRVFFDYFVRMFVRKKKNPSGKVSVQVIDKSTGKYKVIHTIGSSSDPRVIEDFVSQGREWIDRKGGSLSFDFSNDILLTEQVLEGVESFKQIGLDLLLGQIFDATGFNQVEDLILRYLVIYRLAYPKSKLKTVEYLNRYHQLNWHEDQVYRYLDKLYNTHKEIVQQISFDHTQQVLGGQISMVFYDVTTLYFEIDQGDELRKTGFSKEGKHQNPQIVLGLLVSINGYPLAYDIFEGNKFEGQTMLPIISSFKQKYKLDQLVIVADSGLLSQDNIDLLQRKGFQFILGARIKNESKAIKQAILSLNLTNGQSSVIQKDELRLIITYSDKRAKKDLHNRTKGLKRLENQVASGKLTKSNINKRGYNKYLKLEGSVKVIIDQEKFDQDAQWDGLKGYLTNTTLSDQMVLENYQQLWQIEKAFRIAKTDLKIRPIYHRLHRRIEAHICITFVAYKVYKELERLLKEKQSTISPQKAIEIAKSIFQLQITTPTSKSVIKKTLILSEEQKALAQLFGF